MKRSLPLLGLALLAACDDGGPGGPQAQREACDALPSATYAGDVSLGTGETMMLAGGASVCLALPGGGHEYVLAYVDTRALAASETQRELPLDSFTVRAAGAAGSAARASRADAGPALPARPAERFPDANHAPPLFQVNGLPARHPVNRATPWAQGEAFIMYDHLRVAERPARVHRVYDGWLVVASFEDETLPTLAGTLAMLDAGWPSIRQLGMPLMTAVFDGVRPVTSTGSGQLLMLVRPDLVNATGVAYGASNATDVFSWLAILPNGVNTARTPVSLGSLVFHEMTHAHQRSYVHASRPAGSGVTPAAGSTRWGIEGGAALMQRELARRQAGQSLTANFDWRAPGPGDAGRWYAIFAQPGDGSFSSGYSESEDFLAHLVSRRTASGEGADQAVAAVMRGAAEGWHGWTFAGQPRRAGLVSRMRQRLGGAWDPTEALLTWTLGYALDDRTESSRLQVPGFREASNVDPGEYGWRSHGQLAPGPGAPLEAKREYGAAGYFAVSGSGALHLTANVEGVRWMLARAR